MGGLEATQLAESKTPEITLDIWREHRAFEALLDADTWAELARTPR